MEFPASVTNDKRLEGNGYVGSCYVIQILPSKKLTTCPSHEQWGRTPLSSEIGLKLLKDENRHTKCTEGGEGVRNETQGETSTILSFVSAGGKVCPPLVIHKGQRVQETWRLKAPGDIQLSVTTKGYITKSWFHQYGVHFIKYLKKEGLANKKNLLIVDGHKSHLYNLLFYEAMRANGIEVLTIPPHTSHVLQPLDSVPFAQFKKNWEKNLRRYNTTHSGRLLNKIDFWEVFYP